MNTFLGLVLTVKTRSAALYPTWLKSMPLFPGESVAERQAIAARLSPEGLNANSSQYKTRGVDLSEAVRIGKTWNILVVDAGKRIQRNPRRSDVVIRQTARYNELTQRQKSAES